ncbi:hypothetical protein QWJ34_26875 [Saccharibacillus sp. CPCC 101409]|uniref:hypothetical protein n=1 Tax=Saccharibacillus sp. CPCC 101409 TaxID=3058041 RepID=UPI002673BDC4|nr:hypothetical protein [Saccharibacillus sp. CPCC 101409]MDO3413402.1 hypothetical protein [Saccharibacillus sp. CPCC 101409]
MAYQIHIQRADEDHPITLKEWTNYIQQDQELESSNHIEITLPNGMTMGMSGEGMAVWKTTIKDEEIKMTFTFREGEIATRYSSEDQIKKMKDIASKLEAIVVGDEGEEY